MERPDSSKQTQQIVELDTQIDPNVEPEVTALAPTDFNSDINDGDTPKRKPPKRKRPRLLPKLVVGVLLGAGVVAAGYYGHRWWLFNQKYQQTDNANVRAEIYPVTSRIPGIVTQVTVNDNQMVSLGTPLVRLDPRDYQLALTQSRASLEFAKQQAAAAQQNINSNAPVSPPEPSVTSPGNRDAQAARDNFLQAQSAFRQQRDINQQLLKTAQANVTQKQAEVKQAELLISYTNLSALVPGKVANRNVQVGQRILPGQILMEVVQPNPWVVANFKETQIGKIQQGQKAEIRIAAFPSRVFRGKVDSMAATSANRQTPGLRDNNLDNSGDNGNNNRRSDVQLIPVKINFEPESIKGFESRITPGMSADVRVQVK